MTGATAALGIAAASFGGDGGDEGGDGGDEGGDGGAKDTAESPTALPERPEKKETQNLRISESQIFFRNSGFQELEVQRD